MYKSTKYFSNETYLDIMMFIHFRLLLSTEHYVMMLRGIQSLVNNFYGI